MAFMTDIDNPSILEFIGVIALIIILFLCMMWTLDIAKENLNQPVIELDDCDNVSMSDIYQEIKMIEWDTEYQAYMGEWEIVDKGNICYLKFDLCTNRTESLKQCVPSSIQWEKRGTIKW